MSAEKGTAIVADCEFCKIVANLEPARVVFEDAEVLAFLPLNPATLGHTLIIPREHVADFLEAGEALFSDVASAAVTVGRAVRDVIRPEGVNLISSAGEAASQSVFHLHLHIVPRWFGDAMGDIWPPKKPISGELQDELAERIKDAVRRLR